jgi:hypothetical protein
MLSISSKVRSEDRNGRFSSKMDLEEEITDALILLMSIAFSSLLK